MLGEGKSRTFLKHALSPWLSVVPNQHLYLSQMQILRLKSGAMKSKTLKLGPSSLHRNKPPRSALQGTSTVVFYFEHRSWLHLNAECPFGQSCPIVPAATVMKLSPSYSYHRKFKSPIQISLEETRHSPSLQTLGRNRE